MVWQADEPLHGERAPVEPVAKIASNVSRAPPFVALSGPLGRRPGVDGVVDGVQVGRARPLGDAVRSPRKDREAPGQCARFGRLLLMIRLERRRGNKTAVSPKADRAHQWQVRLVPGAVWVVLRSCSGGV